MLFSLDLRDPYGSDPSAQMFSGFTPMAYLYPTGVVLIVVYCVVVTISFCGTLYAGKAIDRRKQEWMDEQRRSSREFAVSRRASILRKNPGLTTEAEVLSA